MNTILFVNHRQQNCGVRSYGFRVAQIFKASKKWNVVYVEPNSNAQFCQIFDAIKPDVVLYNYLPQTMPFLTHATVEAVRAVGVKQGLIVHNIGHAEIFDFYLHQDPRHPRVGNNFPLLRPLFEFRRMPCDDIMGPRRIGTFGFALPEKQYPRICELVNTWFDEAEILMHLTISHFRPNVDWLNSISMQCRQAVTKPGIRLTITTDFRDDEAILDFLAGNDLNVFLYQNFPHYNGISSTVDYALSVRKPIAVCKSGLFSHINDTVPSICVEDRTLPEIMRDGFEPLRGFHQHWQNEEFVRHLEGILDSV